ncbi:MAG: universal stress protein [Oscillochloridaceae bacterium umkhey_bin13]
MTGDREQRRLDAIEEFRRARRRAIIADLLAWIRGEPDDLLDFEEVRQRIGARGWAVQGLRDIPLDAIVGSVGRYHDFTRHFLPRSAAAEARWASVCAAFSEGRRLPPIEVYAIGELYFVKDGNHRVSVARERGLSHLPALVTEVQTRIQLPPDASPEDLIIAGEYANLIEETQLDELRPGLELQVSAAGAYETIAAQIEQRRVRMVQERGTEVRSPEAAVAWYDETYVPLIAVIRERGLLRDFPGRSETDLYVWISQHQAALEADLGWELDPAEVAADLVERRSQRLERVLARARERIGTSLVPAQMRSGPPPGTWRREHQANLDSPLLFRHILVPISGEPDCWSALEQAAILARRDGNHIAGLHVVPPEREAPPDLPDLFAAKCAAFGIEGHLVIEHGNIVNQTCERARWADLVIIRLAHPPAPQPLARLRSGLRDLIERCPQPILAVPAAPSPLNRGLLAYDGSPRAHEALMLAAYLALRGDLSLVVITAAERGENLALTIGKAQDYLEARGIQAGYVIDRRPAREAILAAANEHGSNLIIMGGYGAQPAVEIALGSTVDHILRHSPLPMLICR